MFLGVFFQFQDPTALQTLLQRIITDPHLASRVNDAETGKIALTDIKDVVEILLPGIVSRSGNVAFYLPSFVDRSKR